LGTKIWLVESVGFPDAGRREDWGLGKLKKERRRKNRKEYKSTSQIMVQTRGGNHKEGLGIVVRTIDARSIGKSKKKGEKRGGERKEEKGWGEGSGTLKLSKLILIVKVIRGTKKIKRRVDKGPNKKIVKRRAAGRKHPRKRRGGNGGEKRQH